MNTGYHAEAIGRSDQAGPSRLTRSSPVAPPSKEGDSSLKATRSIFAVLATAVLLAAGACSSNDKTTTKSTTTVAKGNKASSADTASAGSSSDTSSSDSSASDSGASDTSSSGSSSTGSTGVPGSGYSATFKSAFVKGCAGSDPAKEGPCTCVINKVSTTIPYDEFVRNATSGDVKTLLNDPRVVQIITDCKLGA